MKRIYLVLAAAVVMAALSVGAAAPAFAQDELAASDVTFLEPMTVVTVEPVGTNLTASKLKVKGADTTLKAFRLK